MNLNMETKTQPSCNYFRQKAMPTFVRVKERRPKFKMVCCLWCKQELPGVQRMGSLSKPRNAVQMPHLFAPTLLNKSYPTFYQLQEA